MIGRMNKLPRYNWRESYRWNYEHAPDPVTFDEPPVPGKWTYCGLPVASPLSIAAGPLLNGRWCRYYASLGFDTVTYKTVRNSARACYPLPNLQPVENCPLDGTDNSVQALTEFDGSWAVSFGMPSQPLATWQADVAETRRLLPAHKRLSVSVVGTMQPDWPLERLAEDYAECARNAVDCGADVVEFNLSCPNVASCDGQLYQTPADALVVARAVRAATGDTPVVAKVGYFRDPKGIPPLIDALAGYVDAVAATNCIAVVVVGTDGQPHFDGQPRGIAGRAILDASIGQNALIADYIQFHELPMRVMGVGGIASAADVTRYLSAGVEAVQLATAAMIHPRIGMEIRTELARQQFESNFASPTGI